MSTSLALRPSRSNVGTAIIGAPQLKKDGLDLRDGVYTFFSCFPIPCAVYAWRPIFANFLSEPWTIAAVAARMSSTLNDYANPTGNGEWVFNTMSREGQVAGPDNDLPIDGAESPDEATGYPFTVPAAALHPLTGRNDPRYVAGDWNHLYAPDPESSSSLRYLMVRTLIDHQLIGGCSLQRTDDYSGNAALTEGFEYKVCFESADRVTEPAAELDNFDNIPTGTPLIGVQFLSDVTVTTVSVFGDSHPGSGSGSVATYVTRLANAATLALKEPVVPASFVWGGASSDLYWPNALNLQAFIRPDVLLVHSFSFNDPYHSEAALAKQMAKVLSVLERVQKDGGRGIFITPFPRDPDTMANGNTLENWQLFRQWVLRTASERNMAIVDATPIIGSVETGLYRDGMSDDLIHPNDAAITALLPALLSAFRQTIGR